MANLLRAFAVTLTCMGAAACTTPNVEHEVAAYQFGPAPLPDQIEKAVPQYFENVLIDPFSAHYQFGRPYKAWLAAGLIQGGGIAWEGWAVDVRVNSKNRLGGYTGWTQYHVTFRTGVPTNAYEITAGPDVMWHPIN